MRDGTPSTGAARVGPDPAAGRGEEPPRSRAPRRDVLEGRRGALALLAAAQFMSVLDATIITVALPSIQDDLALSASGLSWVVNAYVLTFGGFLLLAGRLADLTGRRLVLMVGWGVFGGASLAAGLAGSEDVLVAARALQGLGAALMVPAALALVTTVFSGRALAIAFGIWGAVGGAAGAAGALLGGALTETLGWEWIFFVNVPVTVVGVAAARALLPEAKLPRTSYDIAGGVTVTAGLTLLVYALVETESNGWGSMTTMVLVAAALALLGLFVAIEARVEHPLVRLGFFRDAPVAFANAAAVLFGASLLIPLFFFSTLYLQQVLGYSPNQAGLAYLPLCATSLGGALIASRVLARTGPGLVLIAGLVSGTVGLLGLAAAPADGSYTSDVLWPFILVGFGLGPVIATLTASGTDHVPAQEAGLASGVINTTQQVGGALGLAVLVSLANARTDEATAAGLDPRAALTAGFELAFIVCSAFSAGAIAFAVLALRARGRATAPLPAAPGAADGPTPFRVVVVGGGFGGLQAALKLRRGPVDITLIDRRNFHLFQPLTYQVATGALAPGEIAHPLRSIFKRSRNVRVMLAEVADVDLAARDVILRPIDGVPAPERVPYDTLIVAGGSAYSYFGHEEWRAHAAEVKSLESALMVRSRLLRAFEAAEAEPDPDRRTALLTFVVVGAGPTGVEMAGQIAELARDTLRRDFRAIDPRMASILLVEAADRVLTTFPPSLSAATRRSLERLGVTVITGTAVTEVDEDGVSLQAQDAAPRRVAAATVVWAAGVTASGLAARLAELTGAEPDRAGRLTVEPDLTLPGHPDVFAIGDMVRVRSATGESVVLPGVAQVAIQQGRHAGRVVRNRLRGRESRPFHYRDKGNLATIGRAAAVADLKWVRLSGLPAWLTWLVVHLFYLVGFGNRVIVLIRWSISFTTRGRGARLITVTDGEPGVRADTAPAETLS